MVLLQNVGIVMLCCDEKRGERNKRRNNMKRHNHAGYERSYGVLLYCYEKKKRERAGYFLLVVQIALADKLVASLSPTLNLEKNVTT
jgi:hypothetical protein